MSSSLRARRLGLVAVAALSLPLITAAAPATSTPTTNISGEVGVVVDDDADFPAFYLRYVGDPAPEGASHSYQWGTPKLLTLSPEDGPVVFTGQLDLTQRKSDNGVGQIGLSDATGIHNGSGGGNYQRGAYMYINTRPNGSVLIAPTDGNAGGGEIVQTSTTIPKAVADAGPIDVTLTIDGTVDPATCIKEAVAGDSVGADGCITIEINGVTLTDSYGSILDAQGDTVEFANGAYPGWEAFPNDARGIVFDLDVTAGPTERDDCKKGGFADYGFENQGQCIRFVNTGVDSRG